MSDQQKAIIQSKAEAFEEAAKMVEDYVFVLGPGNTVRCGFTWAEEFRKKAAAIRQSISPR